MASTYTAKILARIIGSEIITLDTGNVGGQHTITQDVAYAAGTASSEVDLVWSDSRTLPIGTEQLDLTNLTQLDSAGATVNARIFSKVKAIMFVNTTAIGTAGALIFGGGTGGAGAADAWAGNEHPSATDASRFVLTPGGSAHWTIPAGAAVTNASQDILEVQAIGAEMTYEIVIIGNA